MILPFLNSTFPVIFWLVEFYPSVCFRMDLQVVEFSFFFSFYCFLFSVTVWLFIKFLVHTFPTYFVLKLLCLSEFNFALEKFEDRQVNFFLLLVTTLQRAFLCCFRCILQLYSDIVGADAVVLNFIRLRFCIPDFLVTLQSYPSWEIENIAALHPLSARKRPCYTAPLVWSRGL